MSNDKIAKWFCLRVTYGRELAAKKILEENSTEVFIPMRYEYVVKNRRKTKKLVPAVSNLLFAHTDKPTLDSLKQTVVPFVRYIMKKDGEKSTPLFVRTSDMENFMRVSKQVEQDIRYISPEDYCFKAGEKVRIIGGPFIGTEGVFVKVKGARTKRVVVTLDNWVCLATTEIPLNFIEKA